MGDRELTWDACLRALMGRPDPRPVPDTRYYQLFLSPTFHMKACIEVEETSGCVALALVILRDRDALNAVAGGLYLQGAVWPVPAELAKAACWEDILIPPPEQQAHFRRACDEVDPWGLREHDPGAERDGIGLVLRCEAPGRSHTVRMHSPTRQHAPRHHRWVTSLVDMAAACCREQPSADYLASLGPYFRP